MDDTPLRLQKLHVEVLPPKQSEEDLEEGLERFASRYTMVADEDYRVCVPDNAMGHLSFQATELIAELELPVNPDNVMIHVNTFHAKADLDNILNACVEQGIRYVLAVSGDGSERLPRLSPEEMGFDGLETVTSVELLKYMDRVYPGKFIAGVAFNPYEPEKHEFEKMRRKVDAGARFVITQPVVEKNAGVDKLLAAFDLPVVVEAWMSKRLSLLSACVGYEIPHDTAYDPMENLRKLREHYPDSGVYLALLNYERQFPLLEEMAREPAAYAGAMG